MTHDDYNHAYDYITDAEIFYSFEDKSPELFAHQVDATMQVDRSTHFKKGLQLDLSIVELITGRSINVTIDKTDIIAQYVKDRTYRYHIQEYFLNELNKEIRDNPSSFDNLSDDI